MTPALGRIKRAVREAIDLCGGVDGAGASAGRARSTAGDWNNLNLPAFPPLDCALALDEVAAAGGHEPPMVAAMARALGGVFVALPCAGGAADGEADPHGAFIEICAEVGDLARDTMAAEAHRLRVPRELARMRQDIDRLIASAAAFDRMLAEREGALGGC